MRFIHNLSPETRSLLHRIYKESQHHRVRQRAHCILLSCQGINTTALLAIFSVDRITIYNWFDAWEAQHCAGLYDKNSSPYTFFLLNGDMELYRNRHLFIQKIFQESKA